MQTVKPQVILSAAPDIIGALQHILAHSQLAMPDLETSYSQASVPNMNYSDVQLGDQTIGAIITEREEQLDAALQEISDLETVIHSIQNLRQQFVRKKEIIIKSINLHKNFVSTLWRLPTEVLSQIFHQCLPEIEEFQHLQTPSVSEAPILLTTVCRRWREVAVAMPSLWCRLNIAIDYDGQWKRRIFCYKSWLKRSQGCPLSLELFSPDCLYDWTKILHFLRPHAYQISSLCIYIPCTEDQADILGILSPTLQGLLIDSLYMPASLIQSISQLSNLRSLHVLEVILNAELLSLFDPALWARLTDITINADELYTVLHLLQLAPNLSSFHTIFDMIDTTTYLESFTHTKLQSLRITCDCNLVTTRHLSKLFDALSLPNLLVFQVNGEPPWPHEEFKAFLARSKCPLETLIFGIKVETSHEQRAEYVALIPSLEDIVLQIKEILYFAEDLAATSNG